MMDREIITQARFKELLHYDPFTGIFTWKVTRTGSAKPGTVAGYIKNEGYICIKIDCRSYMAHRLAFLYMLGRWPKGDVLHTDGRSADNRWHMLGEGTRAENLKDQQIPHNNKSGTTGVCWGKKEQKWRARIKVNYKEINLGHFKDKADAIAARRSAEREHGFISRPRTQTPLNGHG